MGMKLTKGKYRRLAESLSSEESLKSEHKLISNISKFRENIESILNTETFVSFNSEGKAVFGQPYKNSGTFIIFVGNNESVEKETIRIFKLLSKGTTVTDKVKYIEAGFENGTAVTMRLRTRSGFPAIEINTRRSGDSSWLISNYIKIHTKNRE